MAGIKVVATDLETGESQETEIMDDYILICAGRVRLDHVQTYKNGTVQLTLKTH